MSLTSVVLAEKWGTFLVSVLEAYLHRDKATSL